MLILDTTTPSLTEVMFVGVATVIFFFCLACVTLLSWSRATVLSRDLGAMKACRCVVKEGGLRVAELSSFVSLGNNL